MLRYDNDKSEAGWVLLIVLTFMLVIAMLSWCVAETQLLETKMNNDSWQRQRLFNASEQILVQREDSLIEQTPGCQISLTSTHDILNKPYSWWHSETCTGKFHQFQYYYVVEFIGNDPCAKIDTEKNLGADYFRLTLLVKSKDEGHKIYLESTVAKPNSSEDKCHSKIELVKIGRQSWIELHH